MRTEADETPKAGDFTGDFTALRANIADGVARTTRVCHNTKNVLLSCRGSLEIQFKHSSKYVLKQLLSNDSFETDVKKVKKIDSNFK